LSIWCAKPPTERDAFMARVNAWRDPKPPLIAPEFPHIRLDEGPPQQQLTVTDPYSVDTVAAFVRAIAWHYRRLGDLLAPPVTESLDRPFLPMHISELSAILVQLQEVWRVLGQDAAALFFGHLSDLPAMRYALPLQMISSLSTEEGTGVDLLSAAASWALCGAWPHGGDRESPTVRFSELALFVARNGWSESDRSVAELFAAWDAELGREPTLEALHASLGRAEEFLDRLDQRQAEIQTGAAGFVGDPKRLFEMFLSARTHCVERFCAAPDEYVRPHLYLDVGFETLTAPPVVYEFTGAFGPEAASWEASGFRVYLAGETDSGQRVARIVRAPVSLPGTRQIDEDLAFEALTPHTMTDVLFSPLRWDPEDAELAQTRELLRQLARVDLPPIRVLQ
jgi:hypothetical protein